MRDIFSPPRPNRTPIPACIDPKKWMIHLFSSKAACQGGVVRRNLRDVERIVGWDLFCRELCRRGYRAVVNGGQVVIFCNQAPVHVVGKRA